MNRIVLALVALGSLALAGCQTLNNPIAWGQIATGVGAIVGETRIDPQIEKVSARLARSCAKPPTSVAGALASLAAAFAAINAAREEG